MFSRAMVNSIYDTDRCVRIVCCVFVGEGGK